MKTMVVPLPGPLHTDPTASVYAVAFCDQRMLDGVTDLGVRALHTARAQLSVAVADVETGAWDEQIITWLFGQEIAAVATVASLLRRCWEAGSATGRAERVDEQPIVAHLQASLAALEDDLRDRDARVAELLVSRDVARAECRDLHVEWDYAREVAAARGEAVDGVRDALARARVDDGAGRGPDTVLRELLARISTAVGGVR